MRYLLNLFIVIAICSNSIAQPNLNSELFVKFKKAIVSNNTANVKILAPQIKKQYSKNKIIYYQTLLKSLPNGIVLVTNSYNDTYPLIAIQQSENIKSTVNVISLKLLHNTNYLNYKFNVLNLSTDFDKSSNSIFLNKILNNNKTLVYVSTTVNLNLNHSLKTMYLKGLSLSKYHSSQLKNLEYFYQNYLKNKPINLSANDKELYSNYLPPLMLLYKIKVKKGENVKKLKNDILKFSSQLNKQQQVKQILATYK